MNGSTFYGKSQPTRQNPRGAKEKLKLVPSKAYLLSFVQKQTGKRWLNFGDEVLIQDNKKWDFEDIQDNKKSHSKIYSNVNKKYFRKKLTFFRPIEYNSGVFHLFAIQFWHRMRVPVRRSFHAATRTHIYSGKRPADLRSKLDFRARLQIENQCFGDLKFWSNKQNWIKNKQPTLFRRPPLVSVMKQLVSDNIIYMLRYRLRVHIKANQKLYKTTN